MLAYGSKDISNDTALKELLHDNTFEDMYLGDKTLVDSIDCMESAYKKCVDEYCKGDFMTALDILNSSELLHNDIKVDRKVFDLTLNIVNHLSSICQIDEEIQARLREIFHPDLLLSRLQSFRFFSSPLSYVHVANLYLKAILILQNPSSDLKDIESKTQDIIQMMVHDCQTVQDVYVLSQVVTTYLFDIQILLRKASPSKNLYLALCKDIKGLDELLTEYTLNNGTRHNLRQLIILRLNNTKKAGEKPHLYKKKEPDYEITGRDVSWERLLAIKHFARPELLKYIGQLKYFLSYRKLIIAILIAFAVFIKKFNVLAPKLRNIWHHLQKLMQLIQN